MTLQSSQRFIEHLPRLESEGKMKDIEYELVHSNGTQVIVSMHGRVFFDKKGTFKHTQCILNDITERKQTEGFFKSAYAEIEQAYSGLELTVQERTKELTEANKKLHELDRLKSMFIASMSHELRTPLNSVIGFSSILLNEWAGPLNPEQKENLSTILKAGKHLLALITDVIDVSKIEAGTIDFQASDFDLYDVLTEVVNLFPQEIKEKGLELKSEPIHQILYTDRRRLLQCLINLMSNAVKFTEQGSISLEARKISDNEHIELAVSDTGVGIKEEDLSKLFLSFSRINSSSKRTIPGTGLGLYLTKKLVTEILKGNIAVTSTYGVGSTFTIKIPLKIS
jgi:signal transduction histidine kinase